MSIPYSNLILQLAWTDFKLRYDGSILGYIWTLMKPLLMFVVLHFVFSSLLTAEGMDPNLYSLRLLMGILIFNFFAEGSFDGLISLVSRAQLVTKIYIPRWVIILASTINSFLTFLTSLLVLTLFFIFYQQIPPLINLLLFALTIFALYLLIIIFSLAMAGLFARFRDISQVWDVLLRVIFFASPIVYPLALLPETTQKIILLNPVALIIHFNQQLLIDLEMIDIKLVFYLLAVIILSSLIGIGLYRLTIKKVAEFI